MASIDTTRLIAAGFLVLPIVLVKLGAVTFGIAGPAQAVG